MYGVEWRAAAMARAFVYVIVGGGVAAGYAADEFVKRGVSGGELCIISDEPVAPYERPALSKGYLLPEDVHVKLLSAITPNWLHAAPARLPSFHCCVGTNKERLTPKWYQEHGIELILGTRVQSVNVRQKTLVTATGDVISYKHLIVATGARALKLEEIGVKQANASNVCYLRDLADADRLVNVMQSCTGGNAVVIGGGYIGMECAAALVINKLNVTMVFPESHCLPKLFTPKIATYYEDFYQSKGVKFVRGTVLTSFDFNSHRKVTAVNLKNGQKLPADMVVVGIGSLPNTSLFEGQLTMEKRGIKVDGKMQSSNSSVFAIGDVATFPVKLSGETCRVEHVDFARKSARHAVAAIMGPRVKTGELNYLLFFYSRVFTLSWQFYGDNVGEVVHFGDYSGKTFGAYWIHKGCLVGSFLEGGTKEQYDAIAQATRLKPRIKDLVALETKGVEFALSLSKKPPTDSNGGFGIISKNVCRATGGFVVAASVAAFAYWCGVRYKMW